MFKDYQSRPIVRKAYKIQENDIITKIDEATSSIQVVSQRAVEQNYDIVQFKHYEPALWGDYIVYLSRIDVYHCTKDVFEERNIVE